ncbi:family 1 glycosylhydrolase [Kitasatospora sp. NBC_01302]|uniref:family 1 glycosylhydrolase n=1 Tax=Kitasatospora sp. NBC_01302 TaxID=2903575 RepID=UPI003FA352FB
MPSDWPRASRPLRSPGRAAHSSSTRSTPVPGVGPAGGSSPCGPPARPEAGRRTRCQGVRRPEGDQQRFGLVHVDFATRRRTPKASYAWCRDLIDHHRHRHSRQLRGPWRGRERNLLCSQAGCMRRTPDGFRRPFPGWILLAVT